MDNPLMNVREGMKVYDIDGDQIGTVQEVYFGSGGVTADRPDDTNEVEDILANVFGDRYNMPEEVKQRLIRKGYVRIDGAGILDHDSFILPEQIARVYENKVMLRAEDDMLIDEDLTDED